MQCIFLQPSITPFYAGVKSVSSSYEEVASSGGLDDARQTPSPRHRRPGPPAPSQLLLALNPTAGITPRQQPP